ncbi:WD40 repeat-like protein [Annulohypoxylon maeteangense]|uniref:WD40 repeat-like protein n=1 Tax=Annulohypoxylon maeteangense TaxID=1927788 RepID=UPI0020081C1B|nr:WD40 repeat-like protein [Annulohypoxylon maeteangense]KAI0884818.1 WD40 repeat-like protein [Annulohypoxylon maeteangense]
MAKKARQRISYVLELDHSSSGGHRLGVNGLAVDRDNAILYSGGRDGVICAWDLNLDLNSHDPDRVASRGAKPRPTTKFRASTQAHTHWVNDIVLAANNTALVSASSDLTVKVWRPELGDTEPHTIGQHADYVKCVATPSSADWVASGGLDRKIYLWDLNGKGKSLEIDVRGEDVSEKASVYAMSVGRNILASGGPESIVRLWDPKSGKRITKLVGHTDNIRAIMMNEAGDTVMTASSDQTVKVWSVTAGRCMYTLTMHNDSVWSLFSEDPELAVFYSSDRSGLIVKTDTRGTLEMDEGLSVAVAQEHDGVNKVVACGDYIWTATSSSSINRWTNVETGSEAQLPEAFRHLRASSPVSRSRKTSTASADGLAKNEIPTKSILRISNTAAFPPELNGSSESNLTPGVLSRKGSELMIDPIVPVIEPIHHLPEETIEGQNGLVKHKLLNDRRRVLTLDTAGDVLLWDLIRCKVINRFGKKHLEDVEPEVNTLEAVAPWCSIDTSSGNLTVVLEPFNCFDAEMYADELILAEPVDFREDQRINLGRWILRYLFAKLIDEEIKRDEIQRLKLNEVVEKRHAATRLNPPTSIMIPSSDAQGYESSDSPVATPRANGANFPMTPGLVIGIATPAPNLPGVPGSATTNSSSPLEKRPSQQLPRSSGDDYFSGGISSADAPAKSATTPVGAEQTTAKEETPKSPVETKEKEKDTAKSPSTPFGKKFRMGMSFGTKKLGRSASTSIEKHTAAEEKPEENKSESSSNHDKEIDDNFRGVIQKIQNDYEKQLLENPDNFVETKITPALPIDAPVLKLPPGTKVIIQEETSGGSANLYRGTVMSVGVDADIIEEKAPMWLGEVLLTNTIPQKDPVKVSFVLHPWKDSLPSIATADGNNRLNANRMLRVKKILAYVAERIEPQTEEPEPGALKPEEYLELYCNEQLLPNTMSLATLRAHIWKGGSDVVLCYKANGRKEIPKELPQPTLDDPVVSDPGAQTAIPPIATVT